LRRVAALLAVAGLAVAALGACSPGAATAPAATTPVISDAWVRPPIGADRPAAGYLTITNPGAAAETLVGVTSPIAMSCQIHESSMDSSGMAGMHPIDRLEIPAGGTVTLAPGGYHLMLMESRAMTVGSTVELRLEFEQAGTIVVQAEVREG
jgi:copper(I)-binding protein